LRPFTGAYPERTTAIVVVRESEKVESVDRTMITERVGKFDLAACDVPLYLCVEERRDSG